MSKIKIVTDEELTKIVQHIDAASTLMGVSFKLLFDASNEETVVGFVMGPKEMFDGELEVKEDDGFWTPAKKPTDPKQLN